MYLGISDGGAFFKWNRLKTLSMNELLSCPNILKAGRKNQDSGLAPATPHTSSTARDNLKLISKDHG